MTPIQAYCDLYRAELLEIKSFSNYCDDDCSTCPAYEACEVITNINSNGDWEGNVATYLAEVQEQHPDPSVLPKLYPEYFI